jgi:hypothetical protein
MKIVKVSHEDLLKACDVINALKGFPERFKKNAEETADYFITFMRRNDRIFDGKLHYIVIGYDAIVTAACDPNAKTLEFRPDIEKYLENKDAVDEFIAKLEQEKTGRRS